jgi:hypothetical protein
LQVDRPRSNCLLSGRVSDAGPARAVSLAAEEWLTHTTTERWNTDPTHQRGTAIMRVARSAADFTAADVRAGNDPPSGGALTLDAAAPNGIGQVFPVGAMQDVFLDCAGWDDTTREVMTGSAAYTEGSTDYLDKLFRTLAHAMNPGIPNEAPNPPPGFTVPRLASPTVYCEVEWAGQYPCDDQERAQQTGDPLDFPLQIGPPGAAGPVTLTALDAYVVLTYYLFYPAMQPSPVAQPNFDVLSRAATQTIFAFVPAALSLLALVLTAAPVQIVGAQLFRDASEIAGFAPRY